MSRHFVACLLAGLGVAGALLVSIASFRVIADVGDAPCDAFCEAVFPDDLQENFLGEQGQETKLCLKEARKAGPASFCAGCQADPTRICGPATFAVCCDPASSFCCPSADGPSCHATCTNGHLPDPASCGCVCAPASEECGGSCVACPSGRVLDPASCSCVCPAETEECGGSCVACPSGRVPDPANCSCVCAPGTDERGGRCVPTGQCAAAACQQGTDPETGAVYMVCRADASTAWVSFSQPGGGLYHADQICQLLGYKASGPFGGTCGNVCGFCEGAASCQAPGTESYDFQGACGSDEHGRILCYTVNWECVK